MDGCLEAKTKREAKQGSWTVEGCCSSGSTKDKGVNTTTQHTAPDTSREVI